MSQYSSTEKAAIVMLALGEEMASEIFRNLSRSEVQKIGSAMGRLGKINQETVDIVMSEFRQVMSSQSISGVRGSPEFLKNALKIAFHDSSESQELYSSINRAHYRMRCVDICDAPTLFRTIQNEHSQTIALVLAHASQSLGAALLRFFSPANQTEILTRVARLQEVSYETLHQLDQQICKSIEQARNHGKKIGGVARAAAILNELQKDGEALLDGIGERDPNLSEDIRAEMFRFVDIARLDRHSLEILFKSIERKTWLLSLRGEDSGLLSSFSLVLSERALIALKEDIAALGPQKKSDVHAAQKEIILKAISLEQAGKIQLHPTQEAV